MQWRWYDLDNNALPKFKFLIAGLIVITILCGITLFIYSLSTRPPPPPKPIVCKGLYDYNRKRCVQFPSGDGNYTNCSISGYCAFFTNSGTRACCGKCSEGSDKCFKKNSTIQVVRVQAKNAKIK